MWKKIQQAMQELEKQEKIKYGEGNENSSDPATSHGGFGTDDLVAGFMGFLFLAIIGWTIVIFQPGGNKIAEVEKLVLLMFLFLSLLDRFPMAGM